MGGVSVRRWVRVQVSVCACICVMLSPSSDQDLPPQRSDLPQAAITPGTACKAGVTFTVLDRLWWFGLLAACYRRRPLTLLAESQAGAQLLCVVENRLDPARLARLASRLDSMAARFAGSAPGRGVQATLGLDAKRLALTSP